jgi:hypothetical protein
MKVSTRVKILIATLAIPFVFLALTAFDINLPIYQDNRDIIVPAILAFIEMMLVAWVVNFRLKGERIFTVLVFPALSLAIFVSFLSILVDTTGSSLDRISTLIFSAIVLAIITYILTANINILNLTSIKNIPLGQAGRAAHYVLTLVFSYFSFVLIISLGLPFLLKPLLVFALIFTYTFVSLWTINLAYNYRLLSSLGISLLITMAYMVLGLWPIDSFYYALFMVLVYYMLLGVSLEIREIISKWIWYEYGAIFLTIMLILLATANWGVNGTIF